MFRRIVILHATSARDPEAAFAVESALSVAAEVGGPETEVTVVAVDPRSFARQPGHEGVRWLPAARRRRLWVYPHRHWRRLLRDLTPDDLVLGVEGAAFRARRPVEALRAWLVHRPQLVAAGRSSARTVYLPQVAGPLRWRSRGWVRAGLARVDVAMAADRVSVTEMGHTVAVRRPGLAVLWAMLDRRPRDGAGAPEVIGDRGLPGPAATRLRHLRDGLGVGTTASIDPETLEAPGPARVLVLPCRHLALRAVAAGHYVVFAPVESRSQALFAELGLAEWSHPAARLPVSAVAAQVRLLSSDEQERQRYDQAFQRVRQDVGIWQKLLSESVRPASLHIRPTVARDSRPAADPVVEIDLRDPRSARELVGFDPASPVGDIPA